MILGPGDWFVSTSIIAWTLIQPRRTHYFSRIRSPRLVTLIPVLSTAMMTSSVRSFGVVVHGGEFRQPFEWDRLVQVAGSDDVGALHSRRYLPPTGTNRPGFLTVSYSRISSSSSAIQGRFLVSPFLTRTPCHCSWPSA